MQVNKPLVSVLIPARNAAATLAETLESLLAQVYATFEVVLVDDGSIDETRQVAEQYASKFPDGGMRIFNGPCKGIPAARNFAITHAKGTFLANLDSDDLSEQDRLFRQVEALQSNPDWVAVGSSVSVIDETGKVTGRMNSPVAPDQIRKQLFEKCCLYHSSMMFRREAVLSVGGYRGQFPVAEDYDLYLRLLDCGELGALKEPMVRYRRHSTQTTAGLSRTHRMIADMALLCAIARQHGEDEPGFHEDTLGDDLSQALQHELTTRGLTSLLPKIARHMTKRARQETAGLESLRGLLFTENARAKNFGEAVKALLV